MQDDEIDGIFDHLDPDDFAHETSAAVEFQVDPGVATWEQFVDSQLDATRSGFEKNPVGTLEPVIVLQSASVFRAYAKATESETVQEAVDRLALEARLIQAKWAFAAVMTAGAALAVGATVAPAGTEENAEHARLMQSAGMTRPVIYWWSGSLEDGTLERRQGILTVVGIGRLGEQFETLSEQPSLFDRILSQ